MNTTDELSQALSCIREDVRQTQAYPVQSGAGLVKLDVMENPYRLPEALQQQLGERLGRVALNRYPAEGTQQLAAALARHASLPPEGYGLTLGNGSDELISLLSLAVARPGAVIMSPLPSFVMYGISAQYQHLRFVGVPLRPDFELDEAAMLDAIATERPALLYLSYPNNPTGNLWDEAVIERLIEAAPGLVVLDEAYQPFAERDGLALMQRHPRVLVMRTMSKFGLAGVRIGYLMGRRELVDQVEKLRPPFNVSVLNAEAALFALEHEAVYAEQAAGLRAERERLHAALQQLRGVQVFPSQGNMLLVRVPDAAAVFAGLKARGVLIKNVSGLHSLLQQCLRITIGTPVENQALLSALQATLIDLNLP